LGFIIVKQVEFMSLGFFGNYAPEKTDEEYRKELFHKICFFIYRPTWPKGDEAIDGLLMTGQYFSGTPYFS
jgi:hypothetical protein